MDTNIFLNRDLNIIKDEKIFKEIYGKSILVSGAGGSIGSEICRQCCEIGIKSILLVDNSEFSLYRIHKELVENKEIKAKIIPLLIDIKDDLSMRRALELYKPNIVFHAAAYKHVPMVEYNQLIGLVNNTIGTWKFANECANSSVEKFVMISTDKAVNPTSVMGMTKLLSEVLVSKLDKESNCSFRCVRFGNVLGSSGSVIPLFKEQIAKGGPVTVTHPDMKRYFMTIKEAVSLVLESIVLDTANSNVFILDMGKPMKIVKLAEDLIKQSGFIPYKDIKIEFIGVRPGEKMFEELSTDKLDVDPTLNSKIFIVKENFKDISIDDIYDIVNTSSIEEDLHDKLNNLIYG